MAKLRQSSNSPAGVSERGLPPRLASGPCIEDWAPDERLGEDATSRAFRAKDAWSAAVVEWAMSTGRYRSEQHALQAQRLARTTVPWSREYLLAHGGADLVDRYEGRIAR